MAKVLDVIWGMWEQKYFSENQKNNLTRLSRNSPTGKSRGCSPDGAKRNPGPASRDSRISLRSIRATMLANVIGRAFARPVGSQ
jgi:hypothetical protein